jgi:outer membrane protein TolC
MRRVPSLLLVLLIGSGVASLAAQQPLSLADALQRADRGAYANRIARGESEAKAGQALAPYQGVLPTVRVEAGYLRTTDPLNAFGFTLRQRAVTPAAFAPAGLNDPNAIGDLTTGLVVEQPLFNADALFGRKAAARARDATESLERWTRASTALQVVRGYWGAVLAVEQVRTLEAALAAARSHLSQAESMVRHGMATRSDALLASVKTGEVETALLKARSEARLAKQGLALLMGEPGDTAFALPDSLPSADRLRLLIASAASDTSAISRRADVAAADAGRAAAEADAQRAKSLYLPRVNSFGRVDWHDPASPFGGRSAWTVGVMLSWSPFAGASQLAELKAASGRRTEARVMAEAATAQAQLEAARAGDAVSVCLAGLDIAERAVAQAAEAHRIISRKYEGGLASVTELFDAAATETGTNLGFAAARYNALMAAADQRRAHGRDIGPLGESE